MDKKANLIIATVIFVIAIIGYIMNIGYNTDTYGLNIYDMTGTANKEEPKEDKTYNIPKTEASLSTYRSSTLGYIDSIEYYAGFSQTQDESLQLGYDTPVPGAGTCIKANKTADWTNGDGITTTNACKNFMEAVESKNRAKVPDSASVILDANGKVQDNSKFTYKNITCIYNDRNVKCN